VCVVLLLIWFVVSIGNSIVADVCVLLCDVCIKKLNWNLEIRMDDKDINIPLCENETEEDDTEKHSEPVKNDNKRNKANTCLLYLTKT